MRSSATRNAERSRVVLGAARAALLAAACAVAPAMPVAAQGDAPEGLAVWKRAPCKECHGTFADGRKDDPGGSEFPDGPNLRRTRLDRAAVLETVRCGRPGTDMPSFVAGAYTESLCYGLPPGPVPDNVAQLTALSPRDVEALVDWLFAEIVGRGPATRAECIAYFGNARFCTGFR